MAFNVDLSHVNDLVSQLMRYLFPGLKQWTGTAYTGLGRQQKQCQASREAAALQSTVKIAHMWSHCQDVLVCYSLTPA